MEKSKTEKALGLFIENKAIFILIIVCALVGALSPYFFTVNNLLNVLRQVTVSGIVGIGFTFVVASGNLDLSVGYMLGFIGVVAALTSKGGLPIAVVIIICVLLGALCGVINASFGIFLGISLFISTLAMGSVYRGTNYILCDNAAIGQLPDELNFIGQGYFLEIPIPVWILIALTIVCWFIMNKTKFGRYVLAVGGNREASKVCGINPNAITMGVFVITGICVAIAAVIFTGRAASAQPTAGAGMEMDAIAAVVIGGTPLTGGKGKVVGTIIGCVIIGVINNGLNLLEINTNWQIIVKGLMILIAVLIDIQFSKLGARRRK